MKRNEHGYLIPDTIEPAESYCITIQVPKDDLHVAAFWGALETLAEWYNWQRDEGHSGADVAQVWQAVVKSTKANFIEGCMDCDGIEDCLETSPTITTIEGDVINNTTTITTNTNELTEITINPPDGHVYPDAPDVDTDPDPACGAAYYVVGELRAFIVDLEDSTTTYTDIFDALAGWFISPLAFTVSLLISVLTSIFGGAPSVLTDYDAQLDDMREELYCNGFDKAIFSTYIRTLTSGNEIADYLDCVGLSSWEQWFTIGSADLTQDCTAFCGWCILHDWTTGANGWIKDATPQGAGILGASGWAYEDLHPGGQPAQRLVFIKKTFTSAKITKIDVLCDFALGGWPANNTAIIFITELGASRTDVYVKSKNAAPTGTNINIAWDDASGQQMDTIRLFFRSSEDPSAPYSYGGDILLKAVDICGDAPQPGDL